MPFAAPLALLVAALLRRESVCQIRKAATVPPEIGAVDVAAAITAKSHDAAAQDFRRMSKNTPTPVQNALMSNSPMLVDARASAKQR